jgi:hypothetical protein
VGGSPSVIADAQLTRAMRTVVRRDLSLRRAVRRLGSCLPALPRSERRVLLLRAGDRSGHTRSRTRVARITGLTRRRVTHLERSGLRRLRALATTNACHGAGGSDSATTTAAAVGAWGVGTPTAGGGTTAVADHGTHRTGAGSGSGPGVAPAILESPRDRARELSTSPGGASGIDLALPALLLLGAAAVAVGVREIRRANRPTA